MCVCVCVCRVTKCYFLRDYRQPNVASSFSRFSLHSYRLKKRRQLKQDQSEGSVNKQDQSESSVNKQDQSDAGQRVPIISDQQEKGLKEEHEKREQNREANKGKSAPVHLKYHLCTQASLHQSTLNITSCTQASLHQSTLNITSCTQTSLHQSTLNISSPP